jgi:hypothetical protein
VNQILIVETMAGLFILSLTVVLKAEKDDLPEVVEALAKVIEAVARLWHGWR